MRHLRIAIAVASMTLLTLDGCGTVASTGADGGSTQDDAGSEPRFSSLYAAHLGDCKSCHAPNAPGRTSSTETALDLSSAATAYSTLTAGKAAGLTGNQLACNGVPFVVAGKPEQSLLVATLDQASRKTFDYAAAPQCDESAITDMTVKMGSSPPTGFVASLKDWITSGAQNN
jgi:cytochrome c553